MTKPAILMLPGLLCDRANYEPQIDALAGRYLCHVPHYGQIDSIVGMAEHVLATAPAERFALMGHSMGGRVALEVLRRAPERVERLALLDTGYQQIAGGEHGATERQSRMALLHAAERDGMRVMADTWARGMVHPSRVGTPLFEAVLDMLARSNPKVFAAQINALLNRPDATGLLGTIKCPTLVLLGREDHWSNLARHEAIHAAIPGSRLVVIEDCGHMSTMEQPEAVNRALAEWLDAEGVADTL
ncbi:alpha/beta hydrolase [soil metagenome]